MKTLWLTREQIQSTIKTLAGSKIEDKIVENIMKELNVAEVRAENTPVLNKKFKALIGKKETEIPVKLSNLEHQYLTILLQKPRNVSQ